jgi:hypothetical protein
MSSTASTALGSCSLRATCPRLELFIPVFILLAHTVASAPSSSAYLSFPLGKTQDTLSSKAALFGSSVPMNGNFLNLGLYYVSVSLGTPAQNVRLHVDTGSSTLGVYSSTCTACAADPVSYSFAASPTAARILCSDSACTGTSRSAAYPRCLTYDDISQCAFSVYYGDLSKMQGVLTRDTIKIGSSTATAVFGRIQSSLAIGGMQHSLIFSRYALSGRRRSF